MPPKTERRLAAIVMADVVGYSGYIQRDEVGTRQLFQKLEKNFFLPLSRMHGGRIIKTMGDAFLMEFSSVLNAVTCAVELQKQMHLHVSEAESLDLRRLQFRIAVNLGDIIVEDDDIHGDGVNVVARLQGQADPGGVCISDAVFAQINGKTDIPFEDGGLVSLKGITPKQQVYQWSPERSGAKSTALTLREPIALEAARQASIAVLPFENLSADPEQEYFSDGISEDIITELSRFRDLHVKARNSSFALKGQRMDTAEAGAALDVKYLVEGSVRKAGQRVRVSVQLIDVADGGHIWAERYDRNLEDVFEVQDEITRSIASVLPNRLRSALSERIQRKSTTNYSAYELFLQGRWIFLTSAGADPRAVEFLERALAIDPNYAHAHAVLANLYAYSLFSLGVWYGDPEARARSALGEALKAGQADPTILTLAAETHYWLGESDRARHNIEAALRINPHDVQSRVVYGSILNGAGQSEDGLRVMKEALEMDAQILDFTKEPMAECLYMLRRYEDCLDVLLSWQDPPPHTYAQIAACYAHLGQMDKAKAAAEKFRTASAASSDFARYAMYHARICQLPEDKENWLSGYRMAGLLD
ncbi:adenylate/guanylate cyclase domain-containing protein [Tateyamaria pelophila]|uniref:adenylate/guanylate cyclase domain-containing protein n=1 Tax=Tateyamaria pelophila TaxID=328415 RepID=UPI001CBF5851|nr:adenylate/guanylate cyclase domain-containing protein [Tateyamaria pelophila]